MFDLLPMLLSSVASFLFPIFASYKALKSSDPAQLTPWLMYWVVFSCALLIESWVYFIVSWIPFYGYVRFLFLLYLILPQTQGARQIYEDHVHPFLEKNETQIDEFIARAHSRLTDAGIAYLKIAIEQFKTKVLGLPPTEPPPPPAASAGTQSYTQTLLSRFSVPATRWSGSGNTTADFYSFLSGAVAAATSAAGSGAAGSADRNLSASGTLIPPHLRESGEKMTFIAAQRERLNFILQALDREAQDVQRDEAQRAAQDKAAGGSHRRAPSMAYDGAEDDDATQRPPSGLSMWSGLSKSRSEADFEKIDAESGTEEEASVRRRNVGAGTTTPSAGGGSSWMPWSWGGGATPTDDQGDSTGMQR